MLRRIVIYFLTFMTFVFADDTSHQRITKEDVEKLVMAEVSQKVSFQNFSIELDHWVNKWADEKLKDEEISIENLYVSPQKNRFHAQLSGFKKSKKIFGKIRYHMDIPVLNRVVTSGDEIQKEDLSIQAVEIDSINSPYVMDEKDIVGKTARNVSLKPGVPIQKHQLKAPIIVKKGSVIEIVFEKRSLRISNRGIATRDAEKMENIPFEIHTQNPKQPKKTVYASVVSSQMAKVNL